MRAEKLIGDDEFSGDVVFRLAFVLLATSCVAFGIVAGKWAAAFEPFGG